MFKGIRYYIVNEHDRQISGFYDDIGLARWTAYHLGSNYRVKWELY